MTFTGILYSVKGSEIRECLEARGRRIAVDMKTLLDTYTREAYSGAADPKTKIPLDPLGWYQHQMKAAREPDHIVKQHVDTRAREMDDKIGRLKILADHIEPARVYYLTQEQLTEIGILPPSTK